MLAAKDYWFDTSWKHRVGNTLMNLIPIGRHELTGSPSTLEDTIKQCKAFIEVENRALVMFPEGTRGVPGRMQRFRKGPAIFAMHLNVPIVPVFIYGAHKAWSKGEIFMKPASIEVFILPPHISPEISG